MKLLQSNQLVYVDGYGDYNFSFMGIDACTGKALIRNGESFSLEDVKSVKPLDRECASYCQLYVRLYDAAEKTKNLNYEQIVHLLSGIAAKYDLTEGQVISLITHMIAYIKRHNSANSINWGNFRNDCDAFAYLSSDLQKKQEKGCRVGKFLMLEEVKILGYGNTRFWIKEYANKKYTVYDAFGMSIDVDEDNVRSIPAEESGKTTLMEAAISMMPNSEEIFGVKEEQKNEVCAVINNKDPKVREMKAKVVLQELISEYGIKGVNIPEAECVYSKTFNFDEGQKVLFLERIIDRLQNSSNRDEMDAIKLGYIFLLSAGDIIEWSAKRDIAEMDKDRRAAKNNEGERKLKMWDNPECIDITGNKDLNKPSASSKTTFKGHYMVGDFICDAVEHDGFTKKYVVTSVAEDRIEAEEVKKGIIFGFSPDDEFTRFTKMAVKKKFVKKVDTVNRKKWEDPQCVNLKNTIKAETLTRSEIASLVTKRNPTLGSIAEKFGVDCDELENDLTHKLHMVDLTETEVKAVIETLIGIWLDMPVICDLTPLQLERDISVAIAAVKRSRG